MLRGTVQRPVAELARCYVDRNYNYYCVGHSIHTADTKFHKPISTGSVAIAHFVCKGVVWCAMSLIEQRSVIKFLTRENIPANEILIRLGNVYGASALKISAVKKWRQLFHLGRESVEDDPRPECSPFVLTPDKIEEVRRVVLVD